VCNFKEDASNGRCILSRDVSRVSEGRKCVNTGERWALSTLHLASSRAAGGMTHPHAVYDVKCGWLVRITTVRTMKGAGGY